MPKIHGTKEALQGRPALTPGLYMFRLDGFKPKLASKGNSVNLQPDLKVINHATANDAKIFENLNSQATWVQQDFCHALGVRMEGPDETDLPGEFQGPDADPSQWKYVGPLVGRTGQVELIAKPNTNKPGQTLIVPKRYICQVPGCQVKHTESLS